MSKWWDSIIYKRLSCEERLSLISLTLSPQHPEPRHIDFLPPWKDKYKDLRRKVTCAWRILLFFFPPLEAILWRDFSIRASYFRYIALDCTGHEVVEGFSLKERTVMLLRIRGCLLTGKQLKHLKFETLIDVVLHLRPPSHMFALSSIFVSLCDMNMPYLQSPSTTWASFIRCRSVFLQREREELAREVGASVLISHSTTHDSEQFSWDYRFA